MPSLPEIMRIDLDEAIDALRDSYDPVEQINLGMDLNKQLLDAQGRVAEVRRMAVRQLRMEGWTLREIGEQTGLSTQRVSQIEAGADRREKG